LDDLENTAGVLLPTSRPSRNLFSVVVHDSDVVTG
jgi:hypothetical protein